MHAGIVRSLLLTCCSLQLSKVCLCVYRCHPQFLRNQSQTAMFSAQDQKKQIKGPKFGEMRSARLGLFGRVQSVKLQAPKFK